MKTYFVFFQTVQLRQQGTLELESENKSERGYSWIFKSCAREIYILLVLGTVSHYAHRLVNDTRHRERHFANCSHRRKKTQGPRHRQGVPAPPLYYCASSFESGLLMMSLCWRHAPLSQLGGATVYGSSEGPGAAYQVPAARASMVSTIAHQRFYGRDIQR